MPLKIDIVTAERVVYSDMVDMVIAPAFEGEVGILPRHVPFVTVLKPGELRIKKDGSEIALAVSGGFLQVANNTVRILADTAERAEEIDEARAEAARERAVTEMASPRHPEEAAVALRRSQIRLKVARRRRQRPMPGGENY